VSSADRRPECGTLLLLDADLGASAAARGPLLTTGWTPTAPLSGQRCLTRRAFELASPLAAGWGVDVGTTIDVLRAGLRVVEIPVALRQRPTGTDLAGQLHGARQLRDVSRALAARGLVQVGLGGLRSKGVSSLRSWRDRNR